MAGRGPAPKPADERRRRNATAELTVIEPDGEIHGEDLPETFAWPDVTRAWWLTWRRSAQARTFTDTDWSFLLDTAVLHAEFWLGNRMLAPELRLRAAKFGATPEDRARLKIEVGAPPEATLRPKSGCRRERLLKAVSDSEEA